MNSYSSTLKSIPALFFLILAIGLGHTQAQESEKEQKQAAQLAALKSVLESKRYMFVAQSATPMSGRPRQLTSTYDIQVRNDSLIAYLPYFGKTYAYEYGSSNGGIDFKTTKFDYEKKDAKKGGWDITITPKDVRNVSKIIMRVTDSGYCTVQVNSNTRQSISFYGYIANLQ